MAAKSVTQKGREGRRAKAPAKRGVRAKPAAKATRGKRPVSARAAKPKRAARVSRQSAPSIANTEVELEAAVLRRLLQHFDERKDVQNIELMILAGFCRNCLADWYREAAEAHGETMSKDQARERIYGEPFAQWKAKHQKEATAEQLAAFAAALKRNG